MAGNQSFNTRMLADECIPLILRNLGRTQHPEG